MWGGIFIIYSKKNLSPKHPSTCLCGSWVSPVVYGWPHELWMVSLKTAWTVLMRARLIIRLPCRQSKFPHCQVTWWSCLVEVWEGFGRFSILLVLDEGQGALASQKSVTFLLLYVINPLFPYCSICALSGLFSMFSPVWIVNTMSTLSAAV